MATHPTALTPESPSPQDESSGRPPRRRRPSNALIAVIMLLAAETMFFTGLVGSYLVLRAGRPDWHPLDGVRLPIAVTVVNTVVLLVSAVTMALAQRAARRGAGDPARNALRVTAFLGALFLTIQGTEWARLLAQGLTASSSIYGGTFYTLIGTHGVHVLAGVLWLLWVTLRAHAWGPRLADALTACGLYWYYVAALWLALFVLVYL